MQLLIADLWLDANAVSCEIINMGGNSYGYEAETPHAWKLHTESSAAAFSGSVLLSVALTINFNRIKLSVKKSTLVKQLW